MKPFALIEIKKVTGRFVDTNDDQIADTELTCLRVCEPSGVAMFEWYETAAGWDGLMAALTSTIQTGKTERVGYFTGDRTPTERALRGIQPAGSVFISEPTLIAAAEDQLIRILQGTTDEDGKLLSPKINGAEVVVEVVAGILRAMAASTGMKPKIVEERLETARQLRSMAVAARNHYVLGAFVEP